MVSGKYGRNDLMVFSTDCTRSFGTLVRYLACKVNTKIGCNRASGRIGTATASLSDKSTSRMTKRLTLGHRRLGFVALNCDDARDKSLDASPMSSGERMSKGQREKVKG
jgi:hypothetical protein